MERLSHRELAAELADTSELRNELRMEQIAPVIDSWRFHAELRIRGGHAEAVAGVLADQSERVQGLLHVQGDMVVLYQNGDRTYAGYGNLYRALVALAPHVEDVRFTISDWDEPWIDEYTIAGGELRAERGFSDDRDAYWAARTAARPDDHDLRRFAARMSLATADYWLGGIDGAKQRRRRLATAGKALARAEALDPDSPWLWQLRGQHARARGELAAADRAFEREHELSPRPELSFERAMIAFTRRDDARARTFLPELLAAAPDHGAGHLVAGFLAARAGDREGAAEQLRALLAVFAERRRGITPLDEEQRTLVWLGLEPAHEDLTRTRRHAAVLAWCMKAVTELAAREPELRAPAAALLLGWAEVFRIRRAHGRSRVESARLARALYAAAARLDPLGGSVHHLWSLMLGKRAARRTLEQGLALAPDHLGILGELGALARKQRDYDRAIELLDRYVTVFRRLHTGGSWGLAWDFHRTELAIAHYESACMALYGVPPGKNRPAGKPSDEALDRAEAALAPALAMYESLPFGQQRESAGVFQCMSLIEEYRGHHERALEWAERALAANDGSAYCWSTKAGCLNNVGRLAEAIECAERALALDPEHWHAHYVIACVLAKQGGGRPAIYGHLRRVIALWPAAREELAAEPDLASLRDSPVFRKLVARVTAARPRRR